MSTNVSKIVITVRYELLILVDIPGGLFLFFLLFKNLFLYLFIIARVFNIIINFVYFLISFLQMRVLNLMNSVRLILSNFFNSNNLSLDPKYQYSLKKIHSWMFEMAGLYRTLAAVYCKLKMFLIMSMYFNI